MRQPRPRPLQTRSKKEAAERLAEKRKAERARAVKTHLTKARTSLKAGRFTQADSSVKKALKVHPGHRDARSLARQIRETEERFEAGTLAFNSGNCTAAISSMEQVLKGAPKTSKARTIIAECRSALPPTRLN